MLQDSPKHVKNVSVSCLRHLTHFKLEAVIKSRTSKNLTAVSINALMTGEILAIRIPNFCPPDSCQPISGRVRQAFQSNYAVAPDIKKIGIAFFETVNEDMTNEYYKYSNEAAQMAQRIYNGHEDPIEKLVSILNTQWPSGCKTERLSDKNMYAGLVRIIDEGVELRPHQDNTNWDALESNRAQDMLTQFSANVYFEAPSEGGCLELWDYGIENQDKYETLKVPGDYSLARELIGEPVMRIQPSAGELIVFNARRIHAVSKVSNGGRVNASTFIALHGENEPLTVFS